MAIKHKHHIFSILLAATLITASLFTALPTFAEDDGSQPQGESNGVTSFQLQISPVTNRIVMPTGGGEIIRTLDIYNAGDDTFTYTLYAAPYSVVNESYELNFTDDTARTQLSRWIFFKRDDETFAKTASYTVHPKEKQVITYKINVPDDIPSGGQYASIFAEPGDGPIDRSTGIQSVTRIGALVFGTTEGTTAEKAEISDFTLTGFLMQGKISTSALIKNSGNTDFSASYTLSVKKLFSGSTVYETPAGAYDILPDTTRRINLEWEETPAFGVFRVSSKVTALDQELEQSKIVLIIPLFAIIVMFILLTILIIWLILLFKKRRAQKAKLIV